MAIVGALPFTLQNGTTADATQVMADFDSIKTDVNARAAANGANNDITSLAGLTTPLSVAQGGTGQITIAAMLASYGIGTQGYLFGCTLSNDSGGTTAIAVAAGSARDSTNVAILTRASALTGKVLANAWTVGNGGGLLDTGAVANTTYHIYLIKRVDTGVVDAIASTSASAPTLPANYTLYRRIGSILRESGAIVLFTQRGDEFERLVPINDVNVTHPGVSAVTATLSVPIGIVVDVRFSASVYDVTPATSTEVLLTSLTQTDTTPSVTICDLRSAATGGVTDSTSTGDFIRFTNTSGQIRYRLDVSTTDHTFRITTIGWVDTRGRLA